MAAELALFSLTQLQNLAQFQHQQLNPNYSTDSGSAWTMWNPNKQAVHKENGDDSWEVRAFAEDTCNIMDTTWPPRSYTCTFCRREFRSAQALGGHMNVHRRDRARLHQNHSSNSSSSTTLIIPTQEFAIADGELCFLYQIPNPNGGLAPKIMNLTIDSPSTLLSISPYLPNNMVSPPCPPPSQTSSKTETNSVNKNCKEESAMQELDLELRLGH